jgi:hypothetical protein
LAKLIHIGDTLYSRDVARAISGGDPVVFIEECEGCRSYWEKFYGLAATCPLRGEMQYKAAGIIVDRLDSLDHDDRGPAPATSTPQRNPLRRFACRVSCAEQAADYLQIRNSARHCAAGDSSRTIELIERQPE